jgi:hypothetical protein
MMHNKMQFRGMQRQKNRENNRKNCNNNFNNFNTFQNPTKPLIVFTAKIFGQTREKKAVKLQQHGKKCAMKYVFILIECYQPFPFASSSDFCVLIYFCHPPL